MFAETVSDRIYEALDSDFIRRMRNWVLSTRGTPVAVSGIEYMDDRYHEARMPVLMGEATDIDEAIRSIPGRYHQAVAQFWRFEECTLRWHARRRGVHHDTFQTWVLRGHELLIEELRIRKEVLRARYATARPLTKP